MGQKIKTDWLLFLTVAGLVGIGLVMVYSASSVMSEMKYGSSIHVVVRQFGWAVFSFFALMYFKRRDYREMQGPEWAFAGMGVVVLMLLSVYFLDVRTHRWLRLGSLSIQPSEFAKPALILFLAYFMSRRARAINSYYTLAPAGLVIVLLAGTVVAADLGTAIVLTVTAVVILVVAGVDDRYIMAAVLAGCLMVAGAIAYKPYRLVRIFGYLDPEYKLLDAVDPDGKIKAYMRVSAAAKDPGYHARQSRIAVGSGGILGRGLIEGRQKLFYLPEAHTDFIYAVVGEELGLLGCLLLLAGYVVIFWRGMRLYWIAPDSFGKYLALGVTVSITVQALINMSVVLDLVPTKGIPLPMISQGGSSLLSTLACLGMLMSVGDHSA